MAGIDEKLVARMERFVRNLADNPLGIVGRDRDEARAIVALLPEPVDPDLIEARKISLRHALPALLHTRATAHVENGDCDNKTAIVSILEAIKRGRELEALRTAEGQP